MSRRRHASPLQTDMFADASFAASDEFSRLRFQAELHATAFDTPGFALIFAADSDAAAISST